MIIDKGKKIQTRLVISPVFPMWMYSANRLTKFTFSRSIPICPGEFHKCRKLQITEPPFVITLFFNYDYPFYHDFDYCLLSPNNKEEKRTPAKKIIYFKESHNLCCPNLEKVLYYRHSQ